MEQVPTTSWALSHFRTFALTTALHSFRIYQNHMHYTPYTMCHCVTLDVTELCSACIDFDWFRSLEKPKDPPEGDLYKAPRINRISTQGMPLDPPYPAFEVLNGFGDEVFLPQL